MTAAEVTGSNGSNGPDGSVRDLRIDERTGAVLADHAAWNEEHRRLAEGALGALRDSGALRLLVPERAGGDEREFADMVANVREAALYDGAAAWVLMVLVGHSWMLGSMTEELQDEVYGADPDTIVPGSLAPVGSATECDGGWLIDGRWPFTSGAIWGEWFLLGSQVLTPGERPRLLHVVIPREDIAVDDNWYAIGLRGSGSCDVIAEQAFVPTHRMIDSGDLLGGRSPWSSRHRTSVYRTPILPGLAVHVAATALGLARAGLDDAAERFGVQDDRYMGSSKSKRPGLHMRLAEANTEVRSAELLINDTLGLLRQAADGADSKELRAQAKYQGSYAIELCRRALDRVTTAAGGRAVFDGSRLQQAFRDATMASQHQVADLDTVGEAYGRTRLGMDPGPHPCRQNALRNVAISGGGTQQRGARELDEDAVYATAVDAEIADGPPRRSSTDAERVRSIVRSTGDRRQPGRRSGRRGQARSIRAHRSRDRPRSHEPSGQRVEPSERRHRHGRCRQQHGRV